MHSKTLEKAQLFSQTKPQTRPNFKSKQKLIKKTIREVSSYSRNRECILRFVFFLFFFSLCKMQNENRSFQESKNSTIETLTYTYITQLLLLTVYLLRVTACYCAEN